MRGSKAAWRQRERSGRLVSTSESESEGEGDSDSDSDSQSNTETLWACCRSCSIPHPI